MGNVVFFATPFALEFDSTKGGVYCFSPSQTVIAATGRNLRPRLGAAVIKEAKTDFVLKWKVSKTGWC